MVAQTKMIEKKLEDSRNYKEKGYSNQEIKIMFEKGISLSEKAKEKLINRFIGVQFGDLSQEVYEIQTKLNEVGYDLPIDGNFRNSTLETITRFQTDNDLAPTGIIDLKTCKKLFK